MTDNSAKAPDLQQLQALAELHEQPFHSDVPVIGGLIAWFRSAWNGIATKWYVRPMMAQQTAYNRALVDYLGQLDAQGQLLQMLADDLDRRIIAEDHQQTQIAQQVGETTARIVQLRSALREHECDESPRGEP